jgi:hypothetical protein
VPPPDDSPFDFNVTDWIDPPAYVTELPETTPESNIRAMAKAEYRKSVTPTAWHRYLILGCYVLDGFSFDSTMDDKTNDPLKVYCIVWYQYSYHLNHKIDIEHHKLQAWASTRSQPYLSSHALSAFLLDTKQTSWKEYACAHSLSNQWTEVKNKKKKRKKQSAPTMPVAIPVSATVSRSIPTTIPEETPKTINSSTETRGQKRSAPNRVL